MSTKTKASGKGTTVKTAAKASAKSKKRKTNLVKLCNEMINFVVDANDREIIKRFKTTISSSAEEDISKASLDLVMSRSKDLVMEEFPEQIQPYIKHYLFMVGRNKSKK